MIVIKRIGPNSAFKVGAILGLITSAVFGLFIVGLQGLAFSAIAGLASLSDPYSGGMGSGTDLFATFTLASLCFMYIIYVVSSAIFGGIAGLVGAVAYNLAARWIGGLELELDEDDAVKRKRAYDFDDIYE
jgi:hypothetical protein